MTIFAFVGPSIPSAVRKLYSHRMEILPPVTGGDLPRLRASAGDTVAVIDGYFQYRPSVRHKEILDLLANGIAVYGAASMGALRAAELHAFGMVGHGRVFAAYHSGLISADDEVALLHGTESDDYETHTQALVNVRFALMDAVASGTIPHVVADRFLARARQLPFTERTRDNLRSTADQCGFALEHQRELTGLLNETPDIKQSDAVGLLDLLYAAEVQEPEHPATGSAWQLNETSFLNAWRRAGTGAEEPDAGWIEDSEVHSLAQVLAEDYPSWREHIALRVLALGYRPGDKFPTRLDLPSNSATIHEPSSPAPNHTLETQAIRQLRSLRLLPDCAEASAGFDTWCTLTERDLPEVSRTCKAAARVMFPRSSLAWGDPFLRELKATGTYSQLRSHLIAAQKFQREIAEQWPRMHLEKLRPSKILAHFSEKWNRPDIEDAVLERGFSTAGEFITSARRYYLYDKFHPHASIRCH